MNTSQTDRRVRRWILSHRINEVVWDLRQGELMFEKSILGKASHIKQRMS